MGSPASMVKTIRVRYGFDDAKVLSAVKAVPRAEFVPKSVKHLAYEDTTVPIGYSQTMSQPYTVVFMASLLGLTGTERVLEIGTGSGYQAAILSKLAREVYTVEIIEPLAKRAKVVLKRLGFDNVFVVVGSGQRGWEEKAPYDAIIVTAGIAGKVPQELFDQLVPGGVLVAPVGVGQDKIMTKYKKEEGGIITKSEHGLFHFVPFVKELS